MHAININNKVFFGQITFSTPKRSYNVEWEWMVGGGGRVGQPRSMARVWTLGGVVVLGRDMLTVGCQQGFGRRRLICLIIIYLHKIFRQPLLL